MQNGTSTITPRFVFRGNAMPIGGRVIRIRKDETPQYLQSPPGSSLSVVGGFCLANAPGSIFKDIFSWGQCVAQSQGEERADGAHVTTVTSSILNVSAANNLDATAGPIIFKADQLKLTLVSTHPKTGQPSIVPTEVVFGVPGKDGMSLNGKKIIVTTDVEDFRKMSTLELFDREFQRNEAVYKKYHGRFLTKDGKAPAWKQPIPRVGDGYVVCSIVSSIQWGTKEIPGNVLTLEGFGSIYFGEVLINEYNRRFTIVRLSMGSDVQADVAYAESDPNGSWVP